MHPMKLTRALIRDIFKLRDDAAIFDFHNSDIVGQDNATSAVILHGTSGTGKTAVARMISWPFIMMAQPKYQNISRSQIYMMVNTNNVDAITGGKEGLPKAYAMQLSNRDGIIADEFIRDNGSKLILGFGNHTELLNGSAANENNKIFYFYILDADLDDFDQYSLIKENRTYEGIKRYVQTHNGAISTGIQLGTSDGKTHPGVTEKTSNWRKRVYKNVYGLTPEQYKVQDDLNQTMMTRGDDVATQSSDFADTIIDSYLTELFSEELNKTYLDSVQDAAFAIYEAEKSRKEFETTQKAVDSLYKTVREVTAYGLLATENELSQIENKFRSEDSKRINLEADIEKKNIRLVEIPVELQELEETRIAVAKELDTLRHHQADLSAAESQAHVANLAVDKANSNIEKNEIDIEQTSDIKNDYIERINALPNQIKSNKNRIDELNKQLTTAKHQQNELDELLNQIKELQTTQTNVEGNLANLNNQIRSINDELTDSTKHHEWYNASLNDMNVAVRNTQTDVNDVINEFYNQTMPSDIQNVLNLFSISSSVNEKVLFQDLKNTVMLRNEVVSELKKANELMEETRRQARLSRDNTKNEISDKMNEIEETNKQDEREHSEYEKYQKLIDQTYTPLYKRLKFSSGLSADVRKVVEGAIPEMLVASTDIQQNNIPFVVATQNIDNKSTVFEPETPADGAFADHMNSLIKLV